VGGMGCGRATAIVAYSGKPLDDESGTVLS